jgi:hypothetical protein
MLHSTVRIRPRTRPSLEQSIAVCQLPRGRKAMACPMPMAPLSQPPLTSPSPNPPGLFLCKGFQECIRNSRDLSLYPRLKTGKAAKVIVVDGFYPPPLGDCEPAAKHLATSILRGSASRGTLSVFQFSTTRIANRVIPFWHH